jgi:hypothetical protein
MKQLKLIIYPFVIGSVAFACKPPSEQPDYSDEAELRQIEELATEVLGVDLGEIERTGSQYNFVAVKSEDILVSRRLDSRTYFVQDQRYGILRPAGVFEGSDEELIDFGNELFRRLDIPESEIAGATVMHENIQVARVDSITGAIEAEEPERGQRLARFTRGIDGIPVFSSSLTLGLTGNKEIGFMEFHWPEIAQPVATEAHRLGYMVEHGWQPPEQKGAKVESVEAGIVHSDAPGFIMDAYAAIRVIYMSEEQGVGRKLTLHFDRHGNTVPFPREFDLGCPTAAEPRGR